MHKKTHSTEPLVQGDSVEEPAINDAAKQTIEVDEMVTESEEYEEYGQEVDE